MPKDLFDYDNFLASAQSASDAIIAGTQQATKISSDVRDLNIGVVQEAAQKASAALAPYRAAGASATGELQNLLGLNGVDAQKASTARVLSSPQVQQEIEQGSKAISASASASGLLGSGRLLTELQKFGQDRAVSEISRNQQMLTGLSQIGLGAASTEAQIQSNLGNQIVGQNLFAGETAINSALAAANSRSSLYTTQGQIDLQRQLNRYSFGGGGAPDLMGGHGIQAKAQSQIAGFNPRANINPNNGLQNGGVTGQVGNQIFYGNGVSAPVAGTYGGGE